MIEDHTQHMVELIILVLITVLSYFTRLQSRKSSTALDDMVNVIREVSTALTEERKLADLRHDELKTLTNGQKSDTDLR
jgi:uncharacterized coiled-coil protein SlyX